MVGGCPRLALKINFKARRWNDHYSTEQPHNIDSASKLNFYLKKNYLVSYILNK